MSVEKTNTKVTTSINKKRSKQRDEEIRIPSTTCDVFKAREKSRVQGAIGFGFRFSLTQKLARDFKANH